MVCLQIANGYSKEETCDLWKHLSLQLILLEHRCVCEIYMHAGKEPGETLHFFQDASQAFV